MPEVPSLRRLGLYLRRDLAEASRAILITSAAVGGFVILASLGSAFQRRIDTGLYLGLFTQLLFIGGYIASSLIFREVHHGSRGIFYLTLPGTLLEKVLSKLLISSVGFALGSLALITAAAALSELLSLLVFGYGQGFLQPFQRAVFLPIGVYLATQGVFAVGSVMFRRLAFIKTAFALFVIAVSLFVVAALVYTAVFRSQFRGGPLSPDFRSLIDRLARSGTLQAQLGRTLHGFVVLFRVLFAGVLAPLCWVIVYLRLGETEA